MRRKMNSKHYFLCVLAGLLISAALLLAALAAGSTHHPAAATGATPVPRIRLEFVRIYPNGFDLKWSDPNGGYRGGYELISDSSTGYDVISGMVALPVLASFAPGSATGTVSGLACGATYRLWLVSGDGRDSNTIVGVTGPCGVAQ